MSAALAVGGWVTATVMTSMLLLAFRLYSARKELVARACHELRNPLAAVRLSIEAGARAGEISQSRLRGIELELDRAALALRDLRGAMRRPPDGSTREVVDMGELVGDSVEAWRAAACQRGSHLRLRWTGDEAHVRADRVRLAQAIGNLIANATEHGNGAIEVTGTTGGGWVRVEVLDGGPGLPAPVSELARTAKDAGGGRGRGLAIAVAIVEGHGGRLAAAPSDRGARVVLELPTVNASAERLPARG